MAFLIGFRRQLEKELRERGQNMATEREKLQCCGPRTDYVVVVVVLTGRLLLLLHPQDDRLHVLIRILFLLPWHASRFLLQAERAQRQQATQQRETAPATRGRRIFLPNSGGLSLGRLLHLSQPQRVGHLTDLRRKVGILLPPGADGAARHQDF